MGQLERGARQMKTKSTTIRAALCALVMTLVLAGIARAAQDEEAEAVPVPPTVTESGSDTERSGEADRAPPPVRVLQRQEYGQTITEYERGGRVFLMTVKPRVGPTQYWEDPDGDGQFQRSNSDNIDENINLPKWRLGGW
jgi:hypothetical protein